ncbi:hypothetical protein RFI_21645, partial [Reticulomyxa filosa]
IDCVQDHILSSAKKKIYPVQKVFQVESLCERLQEFKNMKKFVEKKEQMKTNLSKNPKDFKENSKLQESYCKTKEQNQVNEQVNNNRDILTHRTKTNWKIDYKQQITQMWKIINEQLLLFKSPTAGAEYPRSSTTYCLLQECFQSETSRRTSRHQFQNLYNEFWSETGRTGILCLRDLHSTQMIFEIKQDKFQTCHELNIQKIAARYHQEGDGIDLIPAIKDNRFDCNLWRLECAYSAWFDKDIDIGESVIDFIINSLQTLNSSPFDHTYEKDGKKSSIDITLCSESISRWCSNWRTDNDELDVHSNHLPITFNIKASWLSPWNLRSDNGIRIDKFLNRNWMDGKRTCNYGIKMINRKTRIFNKSIQSLKEENIAKKDKAEILVSWFSQHQVILKKRTLPITVIDMDRDEEMSCYPLWDEYHQMDITEEK